MGLLPIPPLQGPAYFAFGQLMIFASLFPPLVYSVCSGELPDSTAGYLTSRENPLGAIPTKNAAQ